MAQGPEGDVRGGWLCSKVGAGPRLGLIFATAMVLILGASPGAAETAGPMGGMVSAPTRLRPLSGALTIRGAFDVSFTGCRNDMLDRAVARFQADVARLSGADLGRQRGAQLRLECRRPETGKPLDKAGEGYRLTVSSSNVRLVAEGPLGVLRGLASLRQLVDRSSGEASIPAVEVNDSPRFAWRGLMIDPARHFLSVAAVKRQIDAMELVKLNILHLHLSDNEGFRVESVRFPLLTKVATHGEYYTQAQIHDLVDYARDRGVTIVPEFDVPGHVFALLTAYPAFGSAPLDPADPAAADSAALNPASPQTEAFVKDLIEEMAGLFPGRYFHVGGDEVNYAVWEKNPEIQNFMKANAIASGEALEARFLGKVGEVLRARGKTMIGWEEIAQSPIPSDVIVEPWLTSNATARVTAKGNPVIVSAGYYLDLLRPAEDLYMRDPLDPSASGVLTVDDVAAIVKADPQKAGRIPDTMVVKPLPPLTPAQRERVLGAEAPLWGELVTDEMLDGRLWPRAAAAAELYWSQIERRDPTDMYRRLIVVQDELRLLGLQDENNRLRMAIRLAPGAARAVMTLAEVVAPVRNYAHGHPGPTPQDLNSIADIASADSLVARRFELDVKAYLGGQADRSAALIADLDAWRDNELPFAEAAKGRKDLEAALPASADVAALSRVGLTALAALQAKRRLSAVEVAGATTLIDRLAAAETASASIANVKASAQPPADLLVVITSAVRALVEAAKQLH